MVGGANGAKYSAMCEMVTHNQEYSPNSNSTSIEEHRLCLRGLVTLYAQYYLPTLFHTHKVKGKRMASIAILAVALSSVLCLSS